MVAEQKSPHSACPYNVLGLKAGASREEVESAYKRLISFFDGENFMDTPQAWVQAQQAYMNIENAYKRIIEGDVEDVEETGADDGASVQPKLGQLLVAAGLVTIDQLEEAISKQKSVELKVGEILKSMSLVTQMELDSFLLNQSLIKLPVDSPYKIGQRLIGLGLVTDDMVRIALVEQHAVRKNLGSILVDRGWLAADILDALLGDECNKEEKSLEAEAPARSL